MLALLLLALGQNVTSTQAAAQHYGPQAGATVPNIFMLTVNWYPDAGFNPLANPWDGGLTLLAGSSDQSGTILAPSGSISALASAGTQPLIPYFCIEPGGAVGPGYRCQFRPLNATAYGQIANVFWISDAGFWDGGVGDTLPDFCFESNGQFAMYSISPLGPLTFSYTYVCGGG